MKPLDLTRLGWSLYSVLWSAFSLLFKSYVPHDNSK